MAADLSRLGQIQGSSADNYALFLKLGIAEVISAYDRKCVFKGMLKSRNITGGKSAAFPVAGKVTAAYHTPGNALTGSINSPSDLNEEIINLDALMVADVAIYELDELMAYWQMRQEYTHQLGQALAVEYDKRVARVIYAAAKRTAEPLAKSSNAGRTGNTATLSAGYAAASNSAKGDELVAAVFNLKAAMERKDVPGDELMLAVGPEEYYYLTQSSRAINADFNNSAAGPSNGTIANGQVLSIAGLPVIKSNHVTQAAYTNVTGDRNTAYAQDLSKCKALLFGKDCAGVLTLKEPKLQVTSNDWNIEYQSTLMVASQSIGMGILRAECAGAISIP
jgi:hypothetical protein